MIQQGSEGLPIQIGSVSLEAQQQQQHQHQQWLRGLQLGLAAASAGPPATRLGEVVGRPQDRPRAPHLCTSKESWIFPLFLLRMVAAFSYLTWQSKDCVVSWEYNTGKIIGHLIIFDITSHKNKKHSTNSDLKFIIICMNSVWESTVLRSALHYLHLMTDIWSLYTWSDIFEDFVFFLSTLQMWLIQQLREIYTLINT